jgi:hypothetical protein
LCREFLDLLGFSKRTLIRMVCKESDRKMHKVTNTCPSHFFFSFSPNTDSEMKEIRRRNATCIENIYRTPRREEITYKIVVADDIY